MRAMHAAILGVGLWAAATAAAGAAPGADCPRRDSTLAEHFVAADCADCWRRGEGSAAATPGWRLDWIVPAGADAPLAAAALVEAAERRSRIRAASAQAPAFEVRLAPPGDARLAVFVGPPWRGYVGVQADVGGRWPRGSTVWLALVEHLPARAEGNAQARDLVRSVSGPLPTPQGRGAPPLSHLSAFRWPENAQPERLRARVWIESAQGRVLAIASPDCALD
jgi:hypothetical protein